MGGGYRSSITGIIYLLVFNGPKTVRLGAVSERLDTVHFHST